jgi:hypothetical protein
VSLFFARVSLCFAQLALALLISHWCIGNTEEKSLFVEQQSEEALNGLALPACGALAKACCS